MLNSDQRHVSTTPFFYGILRLCTYFFTLHFTICLFLLLSVSYLFQSFTEGELQRVIRSLVNRKVGRRTKRAKSAETCSLHYVDLRVTDLGLGHESDETVRFWYCRGTCTRRRSNYDMVLKNVILNKVSEKDTTTKGSIAKTESAPYSRCCRPIKYDNMSFFKNKAAFYTIRNVSARRCGCVWHFIFLWWLQQRRPLQSWDYQSECMYVCIDGISRKSLRSTRWKQKVNNMHKNSLGE